MLGYRLIKKELYDNALLIYNDNIKLKKLVEDYAPILKNANKQLEENNEFIQKLMNENYDLHEQIIKLHRGKELRSV